MTVVSTQKPETKNKQFDSKAQVSCSCCSRVIYINKKGVPIEGTEKVLLAKSSTKEQDKSFLKAPYRHDLMAEPEAQQIINWIIDWMETRVLMPPVLL